MRDHPTAADAAGLLDERGQGMGLPVRAIPCAVAGTTYAHSNRFIARSSSARHDPAAARRACSSAASGRCGGRSWASPCSRASACGVGPFSESNPLVLGIGAGAWPRRWCSRAGWCRWPGGSSPTVPAGHFPATLTSALDDAVDPHSGRLVVAGRADRRAGHPRDRWPRKSFGANAVLTGIDLAIGGGEVVASLVGANGCGKTTPL